MQIEKDILNLDDDLNIKDISLKAEIYIHYALLMAIRTPALALQSQNIGESFLVYSLLIEQIEALARSSNYLDDAEYDEKIKNFMESEEYTKTDDKIKVARLANKKQCLLLTSIFGKSPIKEALKM